MHKFEYEITNKGEKLASAAQLGQMLMSFSNAYVCANVGNNSLQKITCFLIKTSIDLFGIEKCKVTFGFKYILLKKQKFNHSRSSVLSNHLYFLAVVNNR